MPITFNSLKFPVRLYLADGTNNQNESSVYSGLPKDLLIIKIFALNTPHHIPVPLIAEQSDTQYLIFSNPKILCKTLPQWKRVFSFNGPTVNSCLIRHLVNCFRRPSRFGDLGGQTGHGQRRTTRHLQKHPHGGSF